MIIKSILLTGLLFIAVFAYRSRTTATTLAVRRLAGLALFLLAVAAVTFPSEVTRLANWVGVGRGADLVLYALTLTSIFVWIGTYRRLHELESRLARLTRLISIEGALGAHKPDGPESSNEHTVHRSGVVDLAAKAGPCE
jgi:small membrane protein